MDSQEDSRRNSKMLDCIDKCLYSYITCWKTRQGFSSSAGEDGLASLNPSLLECAEICRTTASSLHWDSAFWEASCALCADACATCAWACSRFSSDEQIKAVLDACGECMTACRELAESQVAPLSASVLSRWPKSRLPQSVGQSRGWRIVPETH